MAATSDRPLAQQVMQVRYWQHVVNEAMKKNAFAMAVHCAFGHEAIAVAVSDMMQPLDRLVLSHRNIAYNLARAGALRPIYEEYRRSPAGLGKSVLGTMNLANPERGVVYTSSILGNNMPVACGLALGHQMLKRDGFVACLTGDGAMEEGTFYETMDMSKSQHLKYLLVIENNNMAMSTTIEERRCPIAVEHLCKAFGTPYYRLSGNLVSDYAARLRDIRKIIMAESTPAVVEVDLRNLYRHAGPTPGFPNDPMNIDVQRGLIVEDSAYDPVFVLKQKMSAADFTEMEKEVLAEKWSA